jgi:alkylated DNA nucleotide flippase Atl1
MTASTNSFDLIYQVVREIPVGKVTSYGAIAAI